MSKHADSRALAVVVFLVSGAVVGLACGAAVACVIPSAMVHESVDPAGRWEGAVEVPGTKLGVEVTLAKEGEGWKGTISIPMQGAKDLPLEKIEVMGKAVKFTISGIPGAPTFQGVLADDGSTIAGDFKQGGASLKFSLKRAGESAKAAADTLADFKPWLDTAREAWKVPGVAMAVVKGEKIIFNEGSGFRDIEGKKPVTTNTLFAIGSSTKAFTTATLATLADEGKLDWDAPVRKYLPEFALADETIAAHMTPLDLVTHRSGLPRHDLMWYNAPFTREEIVRRLRYLPANKELRTTFQYNNLMYLTAGYMAGKIAGKPWEDLVRERLFVPLNMLSSNFSVKDSQATDDFALPYEEHKDEIRRQNFRDISAAGPAGSINSTSGDMARWASFHLSNGEWNGKKVLGSGSLDKLHTPQMTLSVLPDPTDSGSIEVGYAMGWFVEVYRGHTLIQHGGNIDGFSAMVAFMPQDKLGFVVLTNKNGTGFTTVAMKHAIDRLLGLERRDWSEEGLAKSNAAKAMGKEAEAKKAAFRVSGTSPTHPLKDYAGEYEHPGYGIAKVEFDGGALKLTINSIATPLEHWHYDTFNGLRNEADAIFENSKVQFSLSVQGDVAELHLATDPTMEDTVFKRKADADLSDPKLLAKFAGEYMLGPQKVKIEARQTTLFLSVPGQPEYELVPATGRGYTLKGLSGFSARFTQNDDGTVKEVTFIQPNGNFTATPVAKGK